MSTLREVYRANGTFASAYFEDTHESADAAREMWLRWQNAREKLAASDVDEPTMDALDEAVRGGDVPVGKSGRALVAAGGTVLVDASLPAPPREVITRYSRLPHLMPLLEHRSATVGHVVVLADSQGGEVFGYGSDGHPVAEETVAGESGPVHKPRGVALKHNKAQRRVEQTVLRNTEEVLATAEKLISRTGARLLVLAGEVQARTALREQLSQRAQQIAVETEEGSRAKGSDDDALWDAVNALVAEQVQASEAEDIERFQAEHGRQGGLAVHGIAAVAGALQMDNVDVLLVSDPDIGGRTVGVGTDPADVSTGDELPEEATEERADEAVLAAAALTGARAVFVPQLTLDDGIGAVLRHD